MYNRASAEAILFPLPVVINDFRFDKDNHLHFK